MNTHINIVGIWARNEARNEMLKILDESQLPCTYRAASSATTPFGSSFTP